MDRISKKNPKPAAAALLIAGAFLLAAPRMVSGQQVFVRMDGIPGESTDGLHRDWIVAGAYFDAITSEATVGGTMAVARTVAARGAKFEDIKILKYIDKSSPRLRGVAAERGMIKTVEIDITRSDGKTFLKVELEGVGIPEISMAYAGEEAKETVHLSFRTIRFTYTEYDSAGKSKGTVSFGWDTQAGKRL